jgi:hypothetical protein
VRVASTVSIGDEDRDLLIVIGDDANHFAPVPFALGSPLQHAHQMEIDLMKTSSHLDNTEGNIEWYKFFQIY